MQTIKIVIIKSFLLLVGLLPLKVARGLGFILAQLVLLFNGRAVKVTRKNIEMCLPELSQQECEHLVRSSIKHTVKLGFEVPIIGHRSFEWLESKVSVVAGEHIMQQAVEKGKGILLLAPHLGNWEALGPFLANYGEVTCLYQRPKIPELDKVIIKFREKGRVKLVPTDLKGVAKIFSTLRKGNISGILPDQIPDNNGGEFAPFFGIPAYTMTFIYKLIQKTECNVVFGVAKRVEQGFEISFIDAPEAIYSEDLQQSLSALNQGVENCIKLCPEQYQWEYKRFRKRIAPNYSDVYTDLK